MWTQTVIGFFSIVRVRRLPGDVAMRDPTDLMVRARRRDHLEALLKHFTPADPKVHEKTGTDYPFRIFIGASELPKLMTTLGGLIDYTNFKGAVEKRPEHKRSGYASFLHRVWHVGVTLEAPREARP